LILSFNSFVTRFKKTFDILLHVKKCLIIFNDIYDAHFKIKRIYLDYSYNPDKNPLEELKNKFGVRRDFRISLFYIHK